MLQVVRGLETDLGLGRLSKTERLVFVSIADLITPTNRQLKITEILAHPDLKDMPTPTFYKCLRDLRTKGLLEKDESGRSGTYQLA